MAIVSGLLLMPHIESQDREEQAHSRPIYEELIKPRENKIVWYSPPKKALPDVSAQERIGTFPTPRAPLKSAGRDDCDLSEASIGEAIHLATGTEG